MIGITTTSLPENFLSNLASMRSVGIECIDCALTNIFRKKWDEITQKEVKDLKKILDGSNISVHSLQSIFYATNLSLCEKNDVEKFDKHLAALVDFCHILDSKSVLFGSPAQRRNPVSLKEFDILYRNLKKMEEVFQKNGIQVNVENLNISDDFFGTDIYQIDKKISFLTNFRINLHIFVEEKTNEDFVNLDSIDSLHVSDKDYSENFYHFLNDENLLSIKKLYKKSPCLIVEMTTSSMESLKLAVSSFREKILT